MYTQLSMHRSRLSVFDVNEQRCLPHPRIEQVVSETLRLSEYVTIRQVWTLGSFECHTSSSVPFRINWRRSRICRPTGMELKSVKKTNLLSRIPAYGIWRRVAVARTDVSEERISSIIRVTRIGELGTTLAGMNAVSGDVPSCGSY
jgi:hypothetical protein